MGQNKIKIKRLKQREKTIKENIEENVEEWAAYWRNNPHRFITDYLELTLYDFQKILIYEMNFSTNFCFVASRGLADDRNICII